MSRLTIHTDGSCYNVDGRMGLGIAWFEDENPEPFYTQVINKHERVGTSNEAEYLAVINALHKLRRPTQQWDEIFLWSDSQLVINQIRGDWQVRGENLINLYNDVQRLLQSLPPVIFQWCPRTNPRQRVVDKLSKQGNQYFVDKRKRI